MFFFCDNGISEGLDRTSYRNLESTWSLMVFIKLPLGLLPQNNGCVENSDSVLDPPSPQTLLCLMFLWQKSVWDSRLQFFATLCPLSILHDSWKCGICFWPSDPSLIKSNGCGESTRGPLKSVPRCGTDGYVCPIKIQSMVAVKPLRPKRAFLPSIL